MWSGDHGVGTLRDCDVCGVGWEVESDGPYFEDDLLKGKSKDAPEVVFANEDQPTMISR